MMKGKIVLVPFPFDDFSGQKVRPAVCLTNAIGPRRHVVLSFISSRAPDDLDEWDLVLEANHPDFPATGLRVTSVLRLHRLVTVAGAMILRELGELSVDLKGQVAERLSRMFAMP